MRVTIIQPDLRWEDKIFNLSVLNDMITPLFNKTDIVIMPEMFSTGFTMNISLSEEPGGATFQWMCDLAAIGNFGICGSYQIKENGDYFNRFVFVDPEGDNYYYYDKRHLFSMGEEHEFYSKGKSRIVFNFRDFRLSPFICYDLRFPVWSRNRNNYDLAIYVASWPAAREKAWNMLLPSRAIENQCYVAGSNRVGIDGNNINHNGMSQIINPKGEILACAYDKEGIISADLSIQDLKDYRKTFNVLNDADDFEIR
ncbi:MAG TPA: amidohydrolase [Bacteroidales bacterium]|nr:amidohydrolase [Bacteroidales bacterium]